MEWQECEPLDWQGAVRWFRVNNHVFELVLREGNWWFYHNKFVGGNPVPMLIGLGENLGPTYDRAKTEAEMRVRQLVSF